MEAKAFQRDIYNLVKSGCSVFCLEKPAPFFLLKRILHFFGFSLLVVMSTLYVTSTISHASGFALYLAGATEVAQSGSVIAHTEGAGSNFYNPALLPDLEGTQISMGTLPIKVSSDYKSERTGNHADTKSNVVYPSFLFLSHKINDKFSAGLGVNNVFGLGIEWPDDWEGRYISTKSELTIFNINPNIAWKVTEKLTLAGGFDVLLGNCVFEQKIPSIAFDGVQKIKLDGEGYGFNLGMLFRVTEKLAIGMSFRSRIKLKLDGDIKFKGVSTVFFPDRKVKLDMDLPACIFTGISYKLSEKIIIEIGSKWEGWSTYKQLNLKFNSPIPALGAGTSYKIKKDWKDVYSFNVGMKYKIDPTLFISTGYQHEGNPVPSHTFDPSVPVAAKDELAFGVQKTFDKFIVALAYNYQKYRSMQKNNNVVGFSSDPANGKFDADIHIGGITVMYLF